MRKIFASLMLISLVCGSAFANAGSVVLDFKTPVEWNLTPKEIFMYSINGQWSTARFAHDAARSRSDGFARCVGATKEYDEDGYPVMTTTASVHGILKCVHQEGWPFNREQGNKAMDYIEYLVQQHNEAAVNQNSKNTTRTEYGMQDAQSFQKDYKVSASTGFRR